MKHSNLLTVILKPGLRKILRVFYEHQGERIHVQQLIRETGMNPHSVDRYLKILDEAHLILSVRVGNLRQLSIESTQIPGVFALFDTERFRALPDLRQHAIHTFLEALPEKPVTAVLFGSTARGTAATDADIDLLLVTNRRIETETAAKRARAQADMRVQAFQIPLSQFRDEVRLKRDAIVRSAIETGYPVFNREYYHELKRDG